MVEDQELEDEDMFEVEKHVHALNFDEAGKYLVAMNRYMEAFAKIVRRGKDDIIREYKKLIKFVKLMIEKLGAYSPIEAADTEVVFKTIVDPQCVAWRRALHSTKKKQETAKKYRGLKRKDGKQNGWWKREK